ncbi:hypothetical protein A6V39_00775 [Candidatus Mycoplasma haematobovis]|uniref:Uncharacterized protein n=1 Tax=Candidatus Mycoplasma haematobovis TaxID=432608 RepID=A0A1A9QF46_9MOLU|nr:hypothetical protein [Candidatus Mycoplasma haematobovis]OAL10585.1 hypothetical protein A6V39_00775 [Candidatus Mycoplasma haematobovis]
MPLPKAGKIAIGLISTGGACGGITYGCIELTSITIKERLKGALVSRGETTKWGARVVKLGSTNDEDISESLKEIKKNNSREKIEGWCYKNIDSKFKGEKDPLFLEVQKFCTYDIKDKITIVANDEGWNSGKNNDKLKKITAETKLSNTMQSIKAKLEAKPNPETDALKNWCKSAYDKQFKGGKDQDYLDAQAYCQAIQ